MFLIRHKELKAQLDDGSIVEYHLCSEVFIYTDGVKNNYEFLGKGHIYSIDGFSVYFFGEP